MSIIDKKIIEKYQLAIESGTYTGTISDYARDNIKFTHDDYMNNKCPHQEYYIQFATSENTAIVMSILKAYGYDKATLKNCFEKDEHLNNTISLKKYNAMAGHDFGQSGGGSINIYDRHLFFDIFKTDYNSSADKVCLTKAIIKKEIGVA